MRAVLIVACLAAVVGSACAPAPAERDGGPAPPPISTGAAPAEAPAMEEPASERPAPPAAPPAQAPSPQEPAEASPPPIAPPRDPLQQMRDEQMQVEDRRLALGRAENRVKAVQSTIAVLEKRLLAVRNPFLPRPQLPPEEAKAWEGLDGAARAKRVEDQLVAARAELEEARKAWVALGGRPN